VLWVGADSAEHLETSIDGGIWVALGGTQKGFKWGAVHNLP
jgi:hypothetical protein